LSLGSPELFILYSIKAAKDQREVSDVVEEENHDAHQPHVGQITKKDKEGAQAVMESVLVKVALCPDEDMRKEAAEVLTELQDIEISHLLCGFIER
jgi:hypothetical protein